MKPQRAQYSTTTLGLLIGYLAGRRPAHYNNLRRNMPADRLKTRNRRMSSPEHDPSGGNSSGCGGSGRLYGIYAHVVFWGTALVVWLAALVLPSSGVRWRLMRRAIHLMAAVTGVRVRIDGIRHLPAPGQPCVLVANHASYLDNPLLVLALPRPFSFVAKAELRDNPAVHLFLRRIGTEFIERRNPRLAAQDLQTLSARARQGRTLLFFPEGTIRRDAGLLPFRLGAFLTAAGEGVPIVPVALNGSRTLLTEGSWWPRRGDVTVTVCPALNPSDFNAGGARDTRDTAQALRDAAREAILEHCGEASAPLPGRQPEALP
jgi:1-acyl-sn-glycerol-3-phosphate acyltransferase